MQMVQPVALVLGGFLGDGRLHDGHQRLPDGDLPGPRELKNTT